MNKKILKHISPDLKIGPRVAIIGSSGKLEDSGLGEEIDSYDDVIRFNRAPTELYEEDVGSKTTIRVVNSHVFANVPVPNPGFTNQDKDFVSKLRNQKLLFWGKINSIEYEIGLERNHSSCENYSFDWDELQTIKNFINYKNKNKSPFAGTCIATICCMSGLEPTLYGFDMDENLPRTHYFGERQPM